MSEKGAIKKSTAQAICDAVRSKEGSTELIPVNALADRITALPTAGGEGDKNLSVYTLDQFDFDGSACTGFDVSKNKYMKTLLNGCIIPYSNNGTVIDTVRGAEMNPNAVGFFSSNFTGYDIIVLPQNIINITSGCFNDSTIKGIIIEADKVILCGDEVNRGRVFRNCRELNTLDTAKLDLSENTTTITTMFQNCEQLPNIDINHWDTSRITDMSYLFLNCKALQTIDVSNWDTSKVVNLRQMFQSCTNLTTIYLNNWNTNKVEDMRFLFNLSSKLQTVNGNIDMLSTIYTENMFYGCVNLTDITLKNIQYSLSFKDCRLLSDASILNTAQELWDKTGHPLQTLTINVPIQGYITSRYVKLIPITDAMREQDPYIDNKKPCEPCEKTDTGAISIWEYIMSKNWAISQ
jgi:surface protein